MERKIAIASTGPSLDSKVEPVLGRADYFIFTDPEMSDVRSVANPFADHSKDIGVKVARLLLDNEVNAALAGNCGPKTALRLREAGVHVGIGYSGIVRDVVRAYAKSES